MRQTRSSTRAREPPKSSEYDVVPDSQESLARTARTTTRARAKHGAKVPETRAPTSTAEPVLPQPGPRTVSNASRPARRSARRPAVAKSIASIRTSVPGDSESDEGSASGEGSASDEGPASDEGSAGDDVGEDVDQEDGDLPMDDSHVSHPLQPSSPGSKDAVNASFVTKTQRHLLRAAQDLYNHLCLADRDDDWESLLMIFSDYFKAWRGLHTRRGALFLDRERIISALDSSSPEASAASNAISAANLAILLENTYLVKDSPEQAVRTFRKIDDGFPQCIMAPESARAESYEKYDTFGRALDIRISLWILDIAAARTFDEQAAVEAGAMLLLGVQPGETPYPNEIDPKTFKFRSIYGIDFDNPSDESSEMQDMRKKIFQAYKGVCEYIVGKVDLEGLQAAFPVAATVDKLFDWAKVLFEEVVKTIEHVPARPESTEESSAVEELPKGPLYTGRESVLALNRARFSPSRTSDPQRGPIGDDEGSDYAPQAEEAGDTEAEDTDEEDTGEDAEEEDTRHNRVANPPARMPQPRQRPRPQTATATGDDGQRTRTPYSRTPAASQVLEPPPKRPRTRVFWDADELQKIEDLVAKYGSFWAQMEAEANRNCLFSIERTQQHIRDKARNMKVDKLKDDQILPLRFDAVVLSYRDRTRLIALGKNPERKEADVEDGQPVNTEWLGSDA